MNRYSLTFLLATLGAMLAGCSTTSSGSIPEPRNPGLGLQWAGDAHATAFDRVLLEPVELQFRAVAPLAATSAGIPGTRTEFPVSERARKMLTEDSNRILREELGRSTRFELTEQAGPGVLVIRPTLRDIVSRTPPKEPPGRSEVLLDRVGEATLVLDFVDGASGRLLGTASDRRSAEGSFGRGTFGAIRANSVEVGQEVRRVLRRWGSSLRKRTEQLQAAARPSH